jgi:ssDNA-binding Zn-finger/Zn-ribbon topoisomerase 1
MADQARGTTSSPRKGRIGDARGRKVTQLDPVGLYLLRQHDVIDADVLHAIAGEKRVRITTQERGLLVVGLAAMLAVASLFARELLIGGLADAPYAKFSSLTFFAILPLVFWFRIKRARFGHVVKAMLKYSRCPHCGYHLAHLPIDPADGATICPECGCAWRLDRPHKAEDSDNG